MAKQSFAEYEDNEYLTVSQVVSSANGTLVIVLNNPAQKGEIIVS